MGSKRVTILKTCSRMGDHETLEQQAASMLAEISPSIFGICHHTFPAVMSAMEMVDGSWLPSPDTVTVPPPWLVWKLMLSPARDSKLRPSLTCRWFVWCRHSICLVGGSSGRAHPLKHHRQLNENVLFEEAVSKGCARQIFQADIPVQAAQQGPAMPRPQALQV
eukprot:1141630-Pelagomonas_calceolata.AAC.4